MRIKGFSVIEQSVRIRLDEQKGLDLLSEEELVMVEGKEAGLNQSQE